MKKRTKLRWPVWVLIALAVIAVPVYRIAQELTISDEYILKGVVVGDTPGPVWTEPPPAPPKEYNYYFVADLVDEIKDNPVRAEQDHLGESVRVDGYVCVIKNEARYFSIDSKEGDSFLTERVKFIYDDQDVGVVSDLHNGSHIIAAGDVVKVDDLTGYYIALDSIQTLE